MKVLDVIISALNLLGRADVASVLSGGGTAEGEDAETVTTLLYCFNAVEDEVARCYLPLKTREEVKVNDGQCFYTEFTYAPVRIKRVTRDGKELAYELFPRYLAVDADKVTVEYEYSPTKKALDGLSDFGTGVGESLFAYGVAAEYCLINGEIEAAEMWESRYRSEIDCAQKESSPHGEIPPRRWV